MSSDDVSQEQAIQELFAAGGLLSRALKGYQPRPQQQAMVRDVIHAYHHKKIALIEAGTGTGKSMAYLVPAILHALQHQERTVISTHTITLQQQLMEKDIPALIHALKAEVKAVLVKGMNNYVCLRKLGDAHEELAQLTPEETHELEKIDQWAANTLEGSKSSLGFMPSHATWERVGMEADACSHNSCPHYKQCFFFRARREAEDAQLLIVNHHLLLADIVSRSENSEEGILPPYSHLVLDEAHNLEDTATEVLAKRVSRLELTRQLNRLASDKKGHVVGKLSLLKQKIEEQFNATSKPTDIALIWSKLEIDLPALRRRLLNEIQDAFHIFSQFFIHAGTAATDQGPYKEQKLRLREGLLQNPYWSGEVQPAAQRVVKALQEYVQTLRGLESSIAALKNERIDERTKSLRLDIQSIASRLESDGISIDDFCFGRLLTSAVKWIEARSYGGYVNVILITAQLDLSETLAENLFSQTPSSILTSATLSTNQQFDFIRRRLGLIAPLLHGKEVSESIYDSPFNYPKQALLLVPHDMPGPSDLRFLPESIESIWEAVKASRGHAFILFTSFQMLRQCYDALAPRLQSKRYPALKQGDEDRLSLLERFKRTPHAVLFGTDSFWEGVDVAGDALRCVIITKLPFKVPTEPIIEARVEALTAQGQDPFMQYSVPQAIVKFKQGFGRLIRNHRDRGCIVCLDTRLVKKGYGKMFLNSLPPCQQSFDAKAALEAKMEQFYKDTYHITMQNAK
jgi:ATP-dependent DNA helicase DinG